MGIEAVYKYPHHSSNRLAGIIVLFVNWIIEIQEHINHSSQIDGANPAASKTSLCRTVGGKAVQVSQATLKGELHRLVGRWETMSVRQNAFCLVL